MKRLEWTDRFSVGVAEIDAQHQRIVGMINRLREAEERGAARADVSEILVEMTDYLDEHFGTEEKYMERFGYPDLKMHRGEHVAFARKTLAFCRAFREGRESLAEVLRFLETWLLDHILMTDAKYGPCFREHGLR